MAGFWIFEGGVHDYDFPLGDGARAGSGDLITTSGEMYPFEIRVDPGDVWLALDDDVAAKLGVRASVLRNVGLGRLRKNFTLPLMPPGDRISIQASQGQALLVIRLTPDPEPALFFPLGELGTSGKNMAAHGRLLVMITLGVSVTHEVTISNLLEASASNRVFGGMVACTSKG